MDKLMRNKKVIALFVLPALIVYSVFFLYPIISSVYYSLTEWNGYSQPVFVGLENFVKLFTKDRAFRTGMKNIGIMLLAVLGV